jgi:SRSO17 transposase
MRQFKKKISEIKEELEQWCVEFRECFYSKPSGRLAVDYIYGLLSGVERKNMWQLAEESSHKDPFKFQKLLSEARWCADQVRDQNIQRVGQRIGFVDGILAFDETGFLKKGIKSAGVGRQYTGTAGKIENCQIGVFASWKTDLGQTLLDRELYLPKDWTDDPIRSKEAHIPENRAFMTKNHLAGLMYERIMKSGYFPAYVTADEVYGRDSKFRVLLERHNQPYVLCVSCDQMIDFGTTKTKMSTYVSRFNERDWKRRSVGDGSKGPRIYDWAMEEIAELENGFKRLVLFRRSVTAPTEIAYYFCYTKREATFNQIVRAAGSRWSIEECFESSKGEVGLDQYEVRTWTGWYRHVTLCMVAHSFLVVAKARTFPAKNPARTPFQDFKKKRSLLSTSVSKNSENSSISDF